MNKVPLLGFNFWNPENEHEASVEILKIFAKDSEQKINFLITPNASDIALYHTKYKHLYRLFKNSNMVFADGMPLVWLSKLIGTPLKKRITGSDLFPALWNEIKLNRKKAYFILPNDHIGKLLEREYFNCKYTAPEFFHPADDAYISSFVNSIIDEIITFRPDFIFIGLTIPKQHKIALEIYKRIISIESFMVIALLGASFEYYFNLKKRAPVFMQRIGLEWFYRLTQDPLRLWKRYTIGNAQFLYIASKEFYNSRRRKIYK